MEKHLGIGKIVCSNNQSATIITFALSTCVAVTAYCSYKKVAGMIHIALPRPYTEEDKKNRPLYFATTGIPLLISEMINKYGCRKEDLCIHIYGGADSGKYAYLKMGSKNLKESYNIFKTLNIKPFKSEVGGQVSRTLRMKVITGEVGISAIPLK
jgi:chemotaxis protein CheD